MKLQQLKDRTSLSGRSKKKYQSLANLINSLNEKKLTEEFVTQSNAEIEELNAISDTDQGVHKVIQKTYAKIYNRAVTKLKYAHKGYYRTLWMTLGMSMFGIPFGVAYSLALDNFAFIGLGLPIGIAIGLAIGSGLEKKAETEGRQLAL